MVLNGDDQREKLKFFFFKICEKLISKQNIIKIFDSNVIKRYYKLKHNTDGVVAYYPSGFENKKKIFPTKKKFERFYILGRLLEENNTELIVKAFSKLKKDKKLFIIGNKNKYFENKIIPLVKENKNIFFVGPIYDRNKLFNICSLCDYYIHGHSVGGTNPTLIEAINLEKKIISYETFFNKEILVDRAVYFKSENELIKIINSDMHKELGKAKFKFDFKADYINKIYLDFMN